MIILILYVGGLIVWLMTSSLVARALGAGNSSMGTIFIASIIGGFVAAPVAFFIDNFILLIIVSLIITTLTYAKMLDINPLGAFVVYLAGSAVWVVIWLLMAWFGLQSIFSGGLMNLGGMDEDVDIAYLERAAEDMCSCGTDEDCLFERGMMFSVAKATFDQENNDPAAASRAVNYEERMLSCLDNPQPYRARRLTEAGNQPMRKTPPRRSAESYVSTESADEASRAMDEAVIAANTADEGGQQFKAQPTPRYQKVELRELRQYLDYHVRITRKDGQSFIGDLVAIDDGNYDLRQRRLGGYFGVSIPRSEVVTAEVHQIWEQTAAETDEQEEAQAGANAVDEALGEPGSG